MEGGRAGHGRTADGRLDLQLSVPEDMGGQGGPGTNPEQLFAVGYAACFQSALLARGPGPPAGCQRLPDHSPGRDRPDRARRLRPASGPGPARPAPSPAEAADLMARADQRCPYSNATRGNIQVTLSVEGRPIERAAA